MRPGGLALGAVSKARLVERLVEIHGFNRREAKDIVASFFEEMRSSLAANEPVKLSGFGNFELRDKRERPGRNPRTGEAKTVTARRVVTFRPGQKLRSRVVGHVPTNEDEDEYR